MGEYWRPVNVTRKEWIHPQDLGDGLKWGEWSEPDSRTVEFMRKAWSKRDRVYAVSDSGNAYRLSMHEISNDAGFTTIRFTPTPYCGPSIPSYFNLAEWGEQLPKIEAANNQPTHHSQRHSAMTRDERNSALRAAKVALMEALDADDLMKIIAARGRICTLTEAVNIDLELYPYEEKKGRTTGNPFFAMGDAISAWQTARYCHLVLASTDFCCLASLVCEADQHINKVHYEQVVRHALTGRWSIYQYMAREFLDTFGKRP